MREDDVAHLATRSAAELDIWLRARLSRQVAVALLAREAELAVARAWAARFDVYGELRVSALAAGETPPALADSLRALAPLDPDAVLLWLAGGAEAGRAWARSVLGALEDLGARDRWVCLLAGPGASRVLARQLGYEDGLPPEVPAGEVAARLARAAVANEAYRRHGSSPPCYLE